MPLYFSLRDKYKTFSGISGHMHHIFLHQVAK